jgi:hypothetical protein
MDGQQKLKEVEATEVYENNDELFTFTVDFIYPSIEKSVSYPIFMEDDTNLVGFFSYKELNSVRCVVNAKSKPLSLFVSSKQDLYFTMMLDRKNNSNFCGILSEVPINVSSIKVSF